MLYLLFEETFTIFYLLIAIYVILYRVIQNNLMSLKGHIPEGILKRLSL